MSFRCDDDLRWLKVNSLNAPGIYNDGESNYLPGGPKFLEAILTFKCSLRVHRAKSLIIAHVGGASSQFWHRKL